MKTENDVLHVGAPNVGSRERFLERVGGVFERNWLTNHGPLVLEFEKRLAEYLGVRHCISMCNGTIALEIAIRALGLSGEVIIPSFTFVATAHALQWQEITPVFCDIDPDSYCIDPSEIERHITPNTSAIIGVHLYSRPCDIVALQQIADKHGIHLMFDAAHAFGCSYKGGRIGSFGECEVFSFHATKFFNSFEGGAIATNNDELAEKVRLMQNFGFADMDDVRYIGTNGKMTEVCAAMGLTNFESIYEFCSENRANYEQYLSELSGVPGVQIMTYDTSEECNWQYVVLEIGDEYPLSRDELLEKLHAEKILARRYFWPGYHRMEPYRSRHPSAGLLLPVTEKIGKRILLLPTGTTVGCSETQRICRIIKAER